MSFELKPTHELLQIASAGGGFRLDATLRPTHELLQIASAAKGGGAKVIPELDRRAAQQPFPVPGQPADR